MGWSLPYTLVVLDRWKMAAVYCQAVLSHNQRIALDGTPAETVDAEAKDLAAKQLACLAARKASKDCGHGEAKTYRRAAGRHATRDAKAIARPGASLALSSENVGTIAAAGTDANIADPERRWPGGWQGK
jgi:hypothetical protein